jgi:hypothetical protein
VAGPLSSDWIGRELTSLKSFLHKLCTILVDQILSAPVRFFVVSQSVEVGASLHRARDLCHIINDKCRSDSGESIGIVTTECGLECVLVVVECIHSRLVCRICQMHNLAV